jgi:hypothetical protein
MESDFSNIRVQKWRCGDLPPYTVVGVEETVTLGLNSVPQTRPETFTARVLPNPRILTAYQMLSPREQEKREVDCVLALVREMKNLGKVVDYGNHVKFCLCSICDVLVHVDQTDSPVNCTCPAKIQHNIDNLCQFPKGTTFVSIDALHFRSYTTQLAIFERLKLSHMNFLIVCPVKFSYGQYDPAHAIYEMFSGVASFPTVDGSHVCYRWFNSKASNEDVLVAERVRLMQSAGRVDMDLSSYAMLCAPYEMCYDFEDLPVRVSTDISFGNDPAVVVMPFDEEGYLLVAGHSLCRMRCCEPDDESSRDSNVHGIFGSVPSLISPWCVGPIIPGCTPVESADILVEYEANIRIGSFEVLVDPLQFVGRVEFGYKRKPVFVFLAPVHYIGGRVNLRRMDNWDILTDAYSRILYCLSTVSRLKTAELNVLGRSEAFSAAYVAGISRDSKLSQKWYYSAILKDRQKQIEISYSASLCFVNVFGNLPIDCKCLRLLNNFTGSPPFKILIRDGNKMIAWGQRVFDSRNYDATKNFSCPSYQYCVYFPLKKFVFNELFTNRVEELMLMAMLKKCADRLEIENFSKVGSSCPDKIMVLKVSGLIST